MFERGKKDELETGSGPAGREAPVTAATRPQSQAGSGGPVAAIGRSIHIDGDLRGEEDLRIEGEVTGTIHLKNNSLTIGAEGKIKAEVFAKSIIVEGTLEGDVYGSENVSIKSSARVQGNVTSPRVSLEDGAKFKGSIEMDQQAVDAALGTSRSSGSATPIDKKSADDKSQGASGHSAAQTAKRENAV